MNAQQRDQLAQPEDASGNTDTSQILEQLEKFMKCEISKFEDERYTVNETPKKTAFEMNYIKEVQSLLRKILDNYIHYKNEEKITRDKLAQELKAYKELNIEDFLTGDDYTENDKKYIRLLSTIENRNNREEEAINGINRKLESTLSELDGKLKEIVDLDYVKKLLNVDCKLLTDLNDIRINLNKITKEEDLKREAGTSISDEEQQNIIDQTRELENSRETILKNIVLAAENKSDYEETKGLTILKSHVDSLERKTIELNKELILQTSNVVDQRRQVELDFERSKDSDKRYYISQIEQYRKKKKAIKEELERNDDYDEELKGKNNPDFKNDIINYFDTSNKDTFYEEVEREIINNKNAIMQSGGDSSASSSDGESDGPPPSMGSVGSLPIGNSPISIKTLVKKIINIFPDTEGKPSLPPSESKETSEEEVDGVDDLPPSPETEETSEEDKKSKLVLAIASNEDLTREKEVPRKKVIKKTEIAIAIAANEEINKNAAFETKMKQLEDQLTASIAKDKEHEREVKSKLELLQKIQSKRKTFFDYHAYLTQTVGNTIISDFNSENDNTKDFLTNLITNPLATDITISDDIDNYATNAFDGFMPPTSPPSPPPSPPPSEEGPPTYDETFP